MNELEQILRALDERELALAVGKKHDNARDGFSRGRAVKEVREFRDFEHLIGEYYAYHFEACVAPGARLPEYEAGQRAKEIIEEEYRRQDQTISSACDDAINGTNGGTRRILDLICDGLKRESTTRYVQSVFDRYVAPNSFDDKVEIIRQLTRQFDNILPRTVNRNRPEQYAHDYKQFVQALSDALRNVARAARR